MPRDKATSVGKGKAVKDQKDKKRKPKGGKGRAKAGSGSESAKSPKRGTAPDTKAQRTTAAPELPSTLERSSPKAQDTWQHTYDSAVASYGRGERAHRTAFSSLKHSFEKVGDHWEEKAEKGPSDDQAARGGSAAAGGGGETAGGVDANASKAHLLDVAKRLGVAGRTRMAKPDLVQAIDKANRRATAHARRDG